MFGLRCRKGNSGRDVRDLRRLGTDALSAGIFLRDAHLWQLSG